MSSRLSSSTSSIQQDESVRESESLLASSHLLSPQTRAKTVSIRLSRFVFLVSIFSLITLTLLGLCLWLWLRNSSSTPKDQSLGDLFAFWDSLLMQTGCNVSSTMNLDDLIDRLEKCARDIYERNRSDASLTLFPDEPFVYGSILEAFAAVRSTPREYGIGAVLVENGRIILGAHNSQLGTNRTDLHAEMTVMDMYETLRRNETSRRGLRYPSNMTLYPSTEPCPMCFTRIITAGVSTKYGYQSSRDGMCHLVHQLPPSWASGASQVICEQALCSPQLGAIAGSLFYSYLKF